MGGLRLSATAAALLLAATVHGQTLPAVSGAHVTARSQ
jgi:hypothetical protein